ncbi:MAG: UbiA prenyltransferase family protein [Candidatus Altiarchaeota archaeon]|nr:UbiA prenyltransferase family protein [Candidatus Altiarchaeota archaeon]
MSVVDYLKAIRIKNWYKASIVLAGPVFSGQLFSLDLFYLFFIFISFALMSSTIYVLNDLIDLDKDQMHPKKKLRPIASGKISDTNIIIMLGVLFSFAMAIGFFAGPLAHLTVFGYFLLMLAYMFYLKNIAIIDAFTIAVGYVLRALAGCFAVGIEATNWFYLVIFVFAIYLAFCKRITELKLSSNEHKKSLSDYEPMAEMGVAMSGAASLSLYSIYALGKGGLLIWSVPLAFLGILLHLRETMKGKEVHESLAVPEIIITFLALVLVVLVSLYA